MVKEMVLYEDWRPEGGQSLEAFDSTSCRKKWLLADHMESDRNVLLVDEIKEDLCSVITLHVSATVFTY